MPTRIKISGITNEADARLAGRLGVDLVACVFWPRSSRHVSMKQCWSIREALPRQVALVGVFVDAPLPLVQLVTDHCQLDHAQLFGREPKDEVEAIRPHAFKAIDIERSEDLESAVRSRFGLRPSRQEAPALLVNLTGPIRDRWEVATGATGKVPTLLASPALDADSVAGAISASRPWGVDVWSAVESEPGQLDPDRLAGFVDAVRAADGR